MASNHMGVDITPAALADGSLLTALDPRAYPQRALGDGTVTTDPGVEGALGVPNVTASTATTGGTLAAGTYDYVVAALNDQGEGEFGSAEQVTTGSTSTVTLTWAAVDGETHGFAVYGRRSVDIEHMADIPHGTHTWTDTGAITPSGAVPAVEDQDVLAGEAENSEAPRPVDPGAQPTELEGGTPPKVAQGVVG